MKRDFYVTTVLALSILAVACVDEGNLLENRVLDAVPQQVAIPYFRAEGSATFEVERIESRDF